MTSSTFVKIGNLTYEVPNSEVGELLDSLQAWANTNDQPVTFMILPAGAKRASNLISAALEVQR